MTAFAVKQQGIRRSARKEFIEQNRLRVSYEKKLRLRMITVFAEIGDKARRSYSYNQQITGIEQFASAKIKTTLDAHYASVIEDFGLRIMRDRKQENQFQRLIRLYIEQQGASRVVGITNTTVKQLASIIAVGEKDGLGVSPISSNIFESMRGAFSRYRAATIARTETHSAASYANHEINASLNIPNQKKRWVATADARTRQTHTAANGTEVDINEDFIIGGVAMGYTGDPRGGPANVINCRCVTLYIDPEDDFEDTQAEADFSKPWGEVSPTELRWQNAAGWDRKSKQSYTMNIIKAIAKVAPVAVVNVRKRAYCSGNGRTINMGTNPEFDKLSPSQQSTWRHEFGHAIDHQKGRGQGIDGSNRPISVAIANEIKSDRDKRIKWSEEQKRKKLMNDEEGERQFLNSAEFTDEEKDLFSDFVNKNPFILEDQVPLVKKLLKWAGSPLDYDDFVALAGPRFAGINSDAFSNFIMASRLGYMNKWQGTLQYYYRITSNDEGLMFTDYIEAISNGNAGFGHGYSYLNKFRRIRTGVTEGHTAEAIANYTALLGGENAAIWRKLMMHHAPETTQKLDEVMALAADSDVFGG